MTEATSFNVWTQAQRTTDCGPEVYGPATLVSRHASREDAEREAAELRSDRVSVTIEDETVAVA